MKKTDTFVSAFFKTENKLRMKGNYIPNITQVSSIINYIMFNLTNQYTNLLNSSS